MRLARGTNKDPARIPQESRKDSSRLYGFLRKACWVLNDLLVLLLVFVFQFTYQVHKYELFISVGYIYICLG